MRTVVVGASSGLGRSISLGLAQRGARVALMARRADRLHAAAQEAGGGAIAVTCDVTDEKSCHSAIEQAVNELGGIDALIYASGVGTLKRLVDTDAQTWRSTLDTNVIGASLMTAAAVPHLAESKGSAIYLSSISASQTAPWPGLGAYIVSKVALEKLVEAWRVEHPEVGFTRISVGDCAGGEGESMTQFSAGWDLELAGEMGPIWFARNLLSGSLMDVEELIRMVDHIVTVGASASIPSVVLAPRRQG